jgi:hypothetical protein
MKRNTLIIIPIFLFLSGHLNAQSLSEKLGAVQTNFKFYSDTVDLNVSDQFIIKKTGSYYSTSNSVAYESFHLEFVSKKRLFLDNSKHLFGDRAYKIDFYNSNNTMLFTINLSPNFINIAKNPDTRESPIFYSIDFINIPIALLDMTSKMVIIETR